MPAFSGRGFDLHYECHGGGEGLPLLLITGVGGTGQGWLVLQVPELSKERACVVYDHRGTGGSGDPGGAFTARDLAEDALALLDHLDLERAHVLGAFLGGLVAQEMALAEPDRVRSLVLVGSFARLDAKRRMLLETWKMQAESGVAREIAVRDRLLWTLHEDTMEQRDLIEAMTRFFLRDSPRVSEKVFARQIDACLAHDALERLGHVAAPTLVVAGEDDILTTPRMTRELANAIPGARMVLMPGLGHLAMAESAPRFNRLVARFLAEYDG